jgi:hypothetical protein
LNSIEFDDAAKIIRVEALIVDTNARDMLEPGVICGFSIGGRYIDKVKQADGIIRYTADLCEISVVDRPALPNAFFQSVKADGSVELRKFARYLPEQSSMTDEDWIAYRAGHSPTMEKAARCAHERMQALVVGGSQRSGGRSTFASRHGFESAPQASGASDTASNASTDGRVHPWVPPARNDFSGHVTADRWQSIPDGTRPTGDRRTFRGRHGG